MRCEIGEEKYRLMKRLRDECKQILTKGFELAVGASPYPPDSIMEVLIYAAMNRTYPETAVSSMMTGQNRPGRGQPGRVPSGETVVDRISAKNYMELIIEANGIIEGIIKRARKTGAFDDDIDAAIDIHNVYRYSKKMWKERKRKAEDLKFVKGTKPIPGTSYAHQFLTVHTINARENYTLSFGPVTPLDTMATCAEEVIRRADEHLGKPIRCVYIDAGGYSAPMIHLLHGMLKDYVIRAPKDDRIRTIIEKAKGFGCWLERGYELRNKDTFVKTNIVVVDVEAVKARKHNFPLLKEKEKYLTFATSYLPREGETLLDFCVRIAITYKGRWEIETSYREENHFHANTHSLSYPMRLFLFALSVILYDLYQLIPVLLSQRESFTAMFGKKMTKSQFSFIVTIMMLEAVGFVTITRR